MHFNRRLFFPVAILAVGLAGSAPALAEEHNPAGMHMAMSGPHVQAMPTQGGQAAFAAIQEIVNLLEASPHTDWSHVQIEALRQHLIDMSELTLHAQVRTREIPGGFSADVTGQGRTLDAIRRMVPTHVQFVNGYRGWSVQAEPIADGYRLVATSRSAAETAHLRGLGFIGVMASQAHHQQHHWMIATGQPMGG